MTDAPLQPITSNALDGFTHGFFTRQGGVSTGVYESLNTGIGSRDERALVDENRTRVASALGVEPDNLTGVSQVHSATVVTVTEPIAIQTRPQADALVTATPGIAISVLTADCGPLLFADPATGIVGAAHAGWKGALGAIAVATVEAMEAIGAQRSTIRAVLGPTISAQNYEVDAAFRERFVTADSANEARFSPSKRDGHFMFDLPGFITGQLEKAGIAASWTGHCTYADEERFFSYRRTTHRGEADYGRMIAAIRSNA